MCSIHILPFSLEICIRLSPKGKVHDNNPCFLSHGGKTRAVRNIGYWVWIIDGGGGKLVLNILKYYLSEIKVSSLEILVRFQLSMIIFQPLSTFALCQHHNSHGRSWWLHILGGLTNVIKPMYTFHCLSLLPGPSSIDFIFCDLPSLLALTWVDCFL